MEGDFSMRSRGRREVFQNTILLRKHIQISFIRTFLTLTPPSHPQLWNSFWKKLLTDSDGITVLSTDWILDSLDARVFLPIRHYTIMGLAPPSWSTLSVPLLPHHFYILNRYLTKDPIRSLKSAIRGLFGSKSTAQKRPLQGIETEESRKKRLFVAVSGVELALQRLRQVTRSADITQTSTSGTEGEVSAEVERKYRKRIRGREVYEVEDSCNSEVGGKSPELGVESEMHQMDGEVERTSLGCSSAKVENWDRMDEIDWYSRSRSDYLEHSPIASDDDEEEEVYYDTSPTTSRTESFNSDLYQGTPEIKVEETYLLTARVP